MNHVQVHERYGLGRHMLAWSVHLYTATGLIAAAGMAVLLSQPTVTDQDVRWTFGLMLIATLIDATDGMLARLVRVRDVLPGFDGRRLDDIVDFLTYATLPIFLIWRAHLVPEVWAPILLLPLLASAYGFSQVSAKTAEGHFLGFPSYWNVVAFYMYLLPTPVWLRIGLLVGLAVLTFVPSRYLYPTQRGALNRFTNALGFLWAMLLIAVLACWDVRPTARTLAMISLVFPAYYLAVSWLVTFRFWRSASETRIRPRADVVLPRRRRLGFRRFLLKKRR